MLGLHELSKRGGCRCTDQGGRAGARVTLPPARLPGHVPDPGVPIDLGEGLVARASTSSTRRTQRTLAYRFTTARAAASSTSPDMAAAQLEAGPRRRRADAGRLDPRPAAERPPARSRKGIGAARAPARRARRCSPTSATGPAPTPSCRRGWRGGGVAFDGMEIESLDDRLCLAPRRSAAPPPDPADTASPPARRRSHPAHHRCEARGGRAPRSGSGWRRARFPPLAPPARCPQRQRHRGS